MEYWAAVVNIIIPNLHTDEKYEGYLVQRQKKETRVKMISDMIGK